MGKLGRFRENGLWRVLTPISAPFGVCTLSMRERVPHPAPERYDATLYGPDDAVIGSVTGPTTWACEAWARSYVEAYDMAAAVVLRKV